MNDAPTSPSGPHRSPRRHGTARRLDGLLDELASRKNLHHAVMAVESMDGTFRWSGARGRADSDGTPMRDDTPFYIASIDKMFTAVVILKLHERDQLDLDAPIGAYLPASLVDGLHRTNGVDRSRDITVRHLLSHTSGLASYLEDRPKGGTSLVGTLVTDGDRAWTIEDVTRIVREKLQPHFAPQALDAPRRRIRYCDTNYALLHEIIRRVTNRPLPEAVHAMVFDPLGLRDTWMVGHDHDGREPQRPASLWANERPLDIPLAMRSLDAIHSTVHDQTRFMRALSRGEPFDDPATFELMRARWTRFGLPLDTAAARAPSWPIQYGLGIKRFQLPRLLTGLRPLPALIGHSGSTGTWTFHCPDLDLVLSGSVDQVTAGAVPYRFVPKIVAALARATKAAT